MIILDRAQSLALRCAATGVVNVKGAAGTGKTALANAISVQIAHTGLNCLLLGPSPELDKPLSFRTASACHPILARRAYGGTRPMVHRQEIDHLAARARLNPGAMQFAARLLRRGRELLERYGLHPDEVEKSLVRAHAVTPEALDLLAIISHDAGLIAEMLWSGNRRNGRSLRDIENAIAGREADVPPDEEPLDLIVTDNHDFERKLTSLLLNMQPNGEEKELAAVVAALRGSISADDTLREVHEQTLLKAMMLRDAIDLVRNSSTPEAALKVRPLIHASRIVEYFVRKHPGIEAPVVIKSFEDALRNCESDRAALAPYLGRHGARTVGSVAQAGQEGSNRFARHYPSIGSFVQRIREARYAARHLPALLGQLRRFLPAPLMREISDAALEEAAKMIEAGRILDESTKAADELRQLRDIFASTGFGDLFTMPADFFVRNQAAASHVTQAGLSYAPEILDLLIDARVHSSPAIPDLKEWPASIMRARTRNELTEIASRRHRFDVVVADDVGEFDADTIERFAAAGTWVHRLGIVQGPEAIALEVPHRQIHFEIANLASGHPERWLAGPGGLGVVVREVSHAAYRALKSAAKQLVTILQDLGRNAAIYPLARGAVADIVVVAVDELLDVALGNLAKCAREGIVILCRRDMRQTKSAPERALPADATTAQILGWRIKRACGEGVLLEKNGNCVALVDEPLALSGFEDLVTDIVDRLSSFGWRPLIAWRNAPRDPDELNRLLEVQAVPLPREDPIRLLVEGLDLSRPATESQEGILSDDQATENVVDSVSEGETAELAPNTNQDSDEAEPGLQVAAVKSLVPREPIVRFSGAGSGAPDVEPHEIQSEPKTALSGDLPCTQTRSGPERPMADAPAGRATLLLFAPALGA
jgi:hypothetical protein